ncbi:MAG: glycoside hydrolase family 15 protein [Chthoniobacterales bacterium]|nr:glycoside hydrolase family 15 protein [Chthoniobacterales bacterium]
MPSKTNHPIQDYGLIGNCETAALINPEGGIDWLCLPAFDGGSFFGALLDPEKGGSFALRPVANFTVERRYLPDSALLETRFLTERGTVVLTDFFVTARAKKARFYDFTSLHPTQKMVRVVRLENGPAVRMQMVVRARPDYARRPPRWQVRAGGFAAPEACLFTSVPLALQNDDLIAEFSLEPGARHFAVLDFSDERVAPDLARIDRWQATTQAFWREWNLFNYYRGPHQEVVRRSAITLKLLTYAPSGAFVAAPTTSLPEVAGGDTNWDYRYTWLRDTGLLIDTLFRVGYSGEAQAFLDYLVRQAEEQEATGDDPVGVLYAIRGGAVPEEEELSHFAGYDGAQPVRIGNRAQGQLQLDTFAHILEAFFYFHQTGGKLTRSMQKLIDRTIETLQRRWQEPDNGLWESVERRLYTYGKLSAWNGLETAGQLVRQRKKEMEKACEEIRRDVLARGLRSAGESRFLAETYDGDTVDAASLLAFTSDFLPTDLARATRERIEQQLADSDLVYRNKKLREKGEGAFLLCSFWRVNHLIKEGDLSRAEALFDDLLQRASPLGLFSEEVDARTGNFLGNFPQAFSHLALIGTILNLDLARRRPETARMSDHEKFTASVGPTVGWRGIIAGSFRVPKTLQLLFASKSKWAE